MSDKIDIFKKLSAKFDKIHWRAQKVISNNNTVALALAYMDARDVMQRLDDVVGPANWSDHYDETPSGRVICRININIDGEWIAKSDGAGDTAVQGEKGGLSDAFKRAAVKWGVGRYLYDFDAVWAECEVLSNGKFKKWTPNGIKKLNAVHNSYTVAPPKDNEPVSIDSETMISQEQINQIKVLAPTAGIEITTIVGGYEVKDITYLTHEEGQKTINNLNNRIKQNNQKDAA